MWCWMLNVEVGCISRIGLFQGFRFNFISKGELLEGLEFGNKISFIKIVLSIVEDVWGQGWIILEVGRFIGWDEYIIFCLNRDIFLCER